MRLEMHSAHLLSQRYTRVFVRNTEFKHNCLFTRKLHEAPLKLIGSAIREQTSKCHSKTLWGESKFVRLLRPLNLCK